MSIAKNPKRNTSDQRAAAFIASAGEALQTRDQGRRLVPVRIPIAMLARIDRAATHLGLTRSGFIVMSAAERLTRMEGE